MKEEMDIILSATDNASDTFEAVSNAAQDLGETLEGVGDEGTQGMDELGDGADKAEEDVRKLGDEAQKTGEEVEDLGNKSESSGATMQMAFQNIADGVMRAKEGVVELGRNLMEALDLAGQQQQQETFLTMSIGAENAAKQMKVINGLVADLPGDDVAIGGLLSQATAKNATITADELERMGTNAADYFAAMSNYGKNATEAQQDLVNYIMQGNTAEIERSPVLAAHIDKLKEAGTIEERNKALQEALTEEGWAGISQQDTYNNKLETFTAMLDRGKRQMGEMFLGAASGAMDFIGDLDEATGGILGMGIAIAGVAGGPMIDMVTGVGQMATGLKAIKDAGAVSALASMLPFIVADEEAFLGLALAEDFALWPILAIIAAIAALGVAVYEVGKYFGWWTDVGSMIDAIWAGIQRLWSAFINHPDVQGFINGMKQAWADLQPYIKAVVDWVMSFFQTSNSGEFDIVRALIDTISAAWEGMVAPIKLVINVVKLLANRMKQTGSSIQNTINNIRAWFAALPGRIRGAISSLVSVITAPFRNAYNGVVGAVNRIKSYVQTLTHLNLSGITNAITKPFTDAYNRVCNEVDKIKAKANSITGGIFNFGGEELAYGGLDLIDTPNSLSSYTTTKLEVKNDVTLTLDLKNVPQGMNEELLYSAIKESFTDKTVLNALVNNNDFQSLDNKVKRRISMKNNRAKGV